MAFSYKEAYALDFQEGDAVTRDVNLITYIDNVTLNFVTLIVANLEVLTEIDNVILQLVSAGGLGNFFMVM